jgi:6-phosphogluconolactonase (cycloisomerase 2 family)
MHVYVQTNDSNGNEIVAYRRGDDGALTEAGRYATGGKGDGVPHLKSQASLALAGTRLFVTNSGSDDVTVFAVADGALELVGRTPSGGSNPTSIAVRGDAAYVLNAGNDANVTGFRVGSAGLEATDEVHSLAGADPAQVGFAPDGCSLLVTDRANDAIVELPVGGGEARTHASSGKTPYGFAFTPQGTLVVTEAAGAQVGEASVSSYGAHVQPVSRSIKNTRSEVCWAAATPDGRFVYVTNFGDDTISSYRVSGDGSIELLDAVAASTNLGSPGLRDEAVSGDGRFLYAIDTGARRVYGWRVEDDGSLAAVGSADGLPETVAGLAAA